MEKRKELIKTILLIFLIISSIVFSFSIVGYKPDYEVLGLKIDKQKELQTREKLQANSFNVLSPNIVLKHNSNMREEISAEGTITKVAVVPGVKDKEVIKEMLKEISNAEIANVRIRNKNIKEVIEKSDNWYTFNYKYAINTLVAKTVYLGENNQATSLDFDTVLITDSNSENIYLYKKNTDNYMQIEFDGDIFNKIKNIFGDNNKLYSKYVINNKNDFYISEDTENLYIDEFNVSKIDLKNVSRNIFINNSKLKYSSLDKNNNEVTDGYSILRETANFITYINPSNVNKGHGDLPVNQSLAEANSFLITGYIPNIDYTVLSIKGDEVKYREVYKESLVFSTDHSSVIAVNVNDDGVYQAKFPRNIRETQIASNPSSIFSIENIDEMLNYLYSNSNLEDITDVERGYKKTYNSKENKFIYSPTWYIQYKGEYLSFVDLKEKLAKGE